MSTISDGQGGAHKGKMWVWPPETLLVRIPSFISITVVGEGASPGRTWKPSDVPVIDGGGVVSYVRLEVEKRRREVTIRYDTSRVDR
jgi:hypothetical protein